MIKSLTPLLKVHGEYPAFLREDKYIKRQFPGVFFSENPHNRGVFGEVYVSHLSREGVHSTVEAGEGTYGM